MYVIRYLEDGDIYTGQWPDYWDVRGPYMLLFGSKEEAWEYALEEVGLDEDEIEIQFIHPLNVPKR